MNKINFTIVWLLISLFLMACGNTEETTFELPATATLLAVTATPEPTDSIFELSTNEDTPSRAINRICMVIEEGKEDNAFYLDTHRV